MAETNENEMENESGLSFKSLERSQSLRERETERLEQIAIEQQRQQQEARQMQEQAAKNSKDE